MRFCRKAMPVVSYLHVVNLEKAVIGGKANGQVCVFLVLLDTIFPVLMFLIIGMLSKHVMMYIYSTAHFLDCTNSYGHITMFSTFSSTKLPTLSKKFLRIASFPLFPSLHRFKVLKSELDLYTLFAQVELITNNA